MLNFIAPFYDVLTVYNLSFNSNCRILSVELNCIFTENSNSVVHLLINSNVLVPPAGQRVEFIYSGPK